MKLFQIEEPDGGPLESDGPGAAIGIELSALNDAAVAVAVGGNAELLPDRDGVRRRPARGLRQADGRFDETALTAMLLALRGQAEKALARPVTHAVVAIERVDDGARQALVVAAAGAGLQVLRVIAAKAAAALVSNVSPVDAAVLGAAVAAEEDAAQLPLG